MQQSLTAGDICTRNTVFATRQLDLDEAALLMRQQHVGCLVVVDETAAGRVPVGMLTDRDIVTAVVARGVDVRRLLVGDVMSADPATARETDSVLDVLAAMRHAGVRRVPVVDARGVLQGVLSLDDVLELLGEELGAVLQALASARQHEQQRRP